MTMQTLDHRPAPPWRGIATAFGIYALAAIAFAAAGGFYAVNANIFAATVALATIGLAAAYFSHGGTRAFALSLGPYGLAFFHVWRIPAALTFFWYGSQDLLPDTFVTRAAWGDLIAGLLAAALFFLPRRKATVLGFHLFGLADFMLAVGTGIFLTITASESMREITLLPVALIPLVGVPISGAAHIAALHMLLRGGKATGAEV
jgi:hypothetical protein